MKRFIAVAMLVVVMMFAGLGTAFAASSPGTSHDSYPEVINGKTTGSSGTIRITPSPENESGGPSNPINVKVNPDGTFTIDALYFTEKGTYRFSITDPNDPNTSYILEVKIGEDEDGNLTTEKVTFYDENGNVVSTLKFSANKGSNGGGSSGSSVSGTTGTPVAGNASGSAVSTKTSDIAMLTIAGLAAAAAIAGGMSAFSRRRSQL